jgi:hypothetical protein
VILDVDLEFLNEGVQLVDAHLDRLQREAAHLADPDGFGEFDRMEYTAGLGFVICQQYMTARMMLRGITKADALKAGPMHRTGIPIAAVVNAAANHWKHLAEWGAAENDNRGKATREVLRTLGADLDQSYVMADVLSRLLSPFPARFERLLPFIASWSDGISGAAL